VEVIQVLVQYTVANNEIMGSVVQVEVIQVLVQYTVANNEIMGSVVQWR
jgi:hypothetical protein